MRKSLSAKTLLATLLLAASLFIPAALMGQESTASQPATDAQDPTAAQPLDLSDELVRDVFMPLQVSLSDRNRDHLLALLDRDAMPDYAQVRDQLAAFVRHYDGIAFRYQLLQATADGDHASALIEANIEALPPMGIAPERRNQQMRFQLKRGPKGWRIVSFKPADFFVVP
jgi:hypothetical protein